MRPAAIGLDGGKTITGSLQARPSGAVAFVKKILRGRSSFTHISFFCPGVLYGRHYGTWFRRASLTSRLGQGREFYPTYDLLLELGAGSVQTLLGRGPGYPPGGRISRTAYPGCPKLISSVYQPILDLGQEETQAIADILIGASDAGR